MSRCRQQDACELEAVLKQHADVPIQDVPASYCSKIYAGEGRVSPVAMHAGLPGAAQAVQCTH